MTQVKLEDLKKQGINEGCLVEIILKEGSKPYLRTTALVSYYGPEKDTETPSTIKYSGYIKYIKVENSECIGLFPGWDNQNKNIPKDARIGGVYISPDSIYSCVKSKK